MNKLLLLTFLSLTLILNTTSAHALNTKITCGTGWFSEETFVLTDGYAASGTYVQYIASGGERLATLYPDYSSSFSWEKDEKMFVVGHDDYKGFRLSIYDIDWSSSEGEHYDKVQSNVYCKYIK